MASGSSGRSGFDFGTDDVLCSYDDFANQESSSGKQSDPGHGSNSVKEFRDSKMGRPSFPPVYNQSEDFRHQELISTVERTMKKYADNLLRFLEGISSRLSQLELYCYNLEKSVGEMRSDLHRENKEADTKLLSLEKHLQEVHRSIQILRDKQELADTQKELAKLQLAHKETSQETEPPSSELKKPDNPPEVQKQQLALALPHQINQPQPQTQTQPAYYPQQTQVPTPPQDRYYQPPPQPQPQTQPQPSQAQPGFPSYQQQWPPQPFPQQPPPQITQTTPPPYPSYPLPETATFPGSAPMQVPQIPRAETMNYGYGGMSRPTIQQRPQQGYMMYDGEGGRIPHPMPSHFPQGGYPPSQPTHVSSSPVRHSSPSPMMRNNPYSDLVEKAVSMGYPRDFVVNVIHGMEESGQAMDFNALLDRLNGGGSHSQRPWSG